MTGRLATLAVLVAILGGCVPASPDTDTFRDASATAVESGLSQVATAERVVRLVTDGDVLRPMAVTVLRDAEEGLGAATSSYTPLDAPEGSDELRRRVTTLLDEADDLVHAARTALHRDDHTALAALTTRLADLANRLEALDGELS